MRLQLIVLILIAALPLTVLGEPLFLATRSGTSLPPKRTVAANVEIGGLYVPRTRQFTDHHSGMLEGTLTWNYRFFNILGLFGQHSVAGLWWGNVSILTMGHEVGARALFGPHLVFEAAYLGHRAEYEWLDGSPWSLGGVNDHGVEVGVWGHLRLFNRLLLEGHLLFRRFDTPTSRKSASFTDQIVFGFGARASIQIVRRHVIVLEIEQLRVMRSDWHQVQVEKITWNGIGTVSWRSQLGQNLGLEFGLSLSSNWYCGKIPMLELKRSMINEPMARGFLRVYFQI